MVNRSFHDRQNKGVGGKHEFGVAIGWSRGEGESIWATTAIQAIWAVASRFGAVGIYWEGNLL